ncbi:hypothetical protein FN846DRAFT_902952 [Sphaerosporella brunnea]|uniref:Alpha and gamma adaptin binding protein p34-domain-containing protein n=1 Tax=Sphaerosporella brunnea TaxID=1250544 RepID=A0A5J5F892_9PEZI|nr:hypothetical protein FN846DRAFT_902952 [Sphaerosporella brunnea]
MPATISNPRRILLVGPRRSGKLTFLKALTDSLPPNIPESHAGLSHELKLETQYYSADVGVWVDEMPEEDGDGDGKGEGEGEGEGEDVEKGRQKIAWSEGEPGNPTTEEKAPTTADMDEPVPLPTASFQASTPSSTPSSTPEHEPAPPTLKEWTSTYLSPLATEVLQALGCIILTYRCASPPIPLLRSLQKITTNTAFDGVCLAVSLAPQTSPEAAGDTCLHYGFEWVDFNSGRRGVRNEFGEPAGMDRVREALEANDWTSDPAEEREEAEGEGLEGIGGEMEREMAALRLALDAEEGDEGEGGEEDVEKLEAVMARLLMVKDMGDSVSKEERRRIAAKAVAELMKS